jgi:phage terminase large subunit-like protein
MAPQLDTHLTDAGLVMWPCKQTMAGLGPASKLLERTIENDQAAHDGNPIMEWMFGNVVLRMDSEGNIKPDKAKSSEKIDGVVAAVMALAAATRPRDDEPEYHEGLVGALL